MQRYAHTSASVVEQASYRIYDVQGRLLFKINQDGKVKGYHYYLNGLLKKKVRYNQLLNLDNAGSLTAELMEEQLKDSPSNRHELHIYNEGGDEIFRIDEEGYSIEFVYNNEGIWVENIEYWQRINATLLHDFTLEEVRKLLGTSEKRTIKINQQDYQSLYPIAPPRAFYRYSLQASEATYEVLWAIANDLAVNPTQYSNLLFQENGDLKPIIYHSNNLTALAKILTLLSQEAAEEVSHRLDRNYLNAILRHPTHFIIFLLLHPVASAHLNLLDLLHESISKRERRVLRGHYIFATMCHYPHKADELAKQAWAIDLIYDGNELTKIIMKFPHLALELLGKANNRHLIQRGAQAIDILLANPRTLPYFLEDEQLGNLKLFAEEMNQLKRMFPEIALNLEMLNQNGTSEQGLMVEYKYNGSRLLIQKTQRGLTTSTTTTYDVTGFEEISFSHVFPLILLCDILPLLITIFSHSDFPKRSQHRRTYFEIDADEIIKSRDVPPFTTNAEKLINLIGDKAKYVQCLPYLFLVTSAENKARLAVVLVKQTLLHRPMTSTMEFLQRLRKILYMYVLPFQPLDMDSILPLLHALEEINEPAIYLIRGYLLQQAAEVAAFDKKCHSETLELMLLDAMRALGKAFMMLPEAKCQMAIQELLWHICDIQGEAFPLLKTYFHRLYFEFQQRSDTETFVPTFGRFKATDTDETKQVYRPSINFLLEHSLFSQWLDKMNEEAKKPVEAPSTPKLTR